MRKYSKIVSLLLVLCLAFGLTACGGGADTPAANVAPAEDSAPAADAGSDTGNEAAAETEAGGMDLSERVDLVFYVMGDAPTDEVLVEDAINEKLLEKLNATVDFQFSTWTDFQQKYSLELTSGNADMIYIANWLNYGQLAASGAFEELDGLMDTYAPNLKNIVDEGKLNACRVDGSLYAIPATWDEYVSNGIKYREDLRVKYNLPVPNSLENIEAYFQGIKENEPNMAVLMCTTEESQGFFTGFDAAWVFNVKYPWVATNGLPYGLAANYDTPNQVYDYWYSDDFVEDCQLLKKWADLGFWSRSALSDTNDAEAFNNGLCAAEIAGQNPAKHIGAVTVFRDQHPEWQSEYFVYSEANGIAYPGHPTQNGTAIVRGCANPGRALAVIDYLMSDETMNRLVQAGIEGTHYEIVDGIYNDLTKGLSPDDFMYEGFNTWNLRNGDLKLLQETSVETEKLFAHYAEVGAGTKFPNVNIYDGFTEDFEAYSAERTAVSNVIKQYLAPLQAGLVTDVDAAVAEFRQMMTDAGLETVREGFQEQWLAYCDEYGYK